MQLQGPTTADVPQLPPTPLHETWLLEQPLPVAIVALLLLGGIGLAMLRRGNKARGLALLSASLLAASGLMTLGAIVETPREAISSRSSELVGVVADGDLARLEGLLDLSATISQPNFRFPFRIERSGREAVLEEVRQFAGSGVVGSLVVLERRAATEGPQVGVSQVRVRALDGEGGWVGHSWWRLDWVLRDRGWVVRDIRPLWFQGG